MAQLMYAKTSRFKLRFPSANHGGALFVSANSAGGSCKNFGGVRLAPPAALGVPAIIF
jgi:hypothetical protein